MKFSRLTLAVAAFLGTGAASTAHAIDLYVDVKTKQIYAEPGPHRQLMGAFERVEDKPAVAPADTAEIAAVHKDLEMKTNEINALKEHMAEAEKVKVKMDKKGLQVESADNAFKFKLGGRIHADSQFSSGDDYLDKSRPPLHVEANDGTEIRRARMRFEGVFYNDWLFRTEADFADDNVRVKDAFIEYLGLKDYVVITAGQQKQNFSRELQESSNDMMFTERSLMNILNNPTVDRAIGLNFQSFGKTYTAKLGIYGDSITPARTGTTPEVKNAGDEGWGISSRLVYNPIIEKTKLIHLGIAGNYRIPDDTGDVAKANQLRYQYETNNMSNLDLVDARVFDVDNIAMLGLEAAGLYGPFSVGAEYTRSWIDRQKKGTIIENGDSNLELDGWYVDAAWSITGESRGYKSGSFGYLEPDKPFSLKNGGWGAWELAARYSSADLNDGSFLGGELSNVTVALNWYINSNFRILANYTRLLDIENSPLTTSTSATLTGNNADLNTYMLRAQVAY
ncbi:OprO/OprP family phosphate-selective porin [Methyloglobulus sp.]|uniref:OprO/OprP family phosphate-selective porin n=1 Tax=Methyloglobulus sp. TaxID=2518622 RepID=UPI0039898532